MKNLYLRVAIRRDKGLAVKAEAEQIDGWEGWFQRGWEITSEDSSLYAGELAMLPVHSQGWPADAPSWIASGDLIKTEKETK